MYDAIIIGARCAGSPTAMLLARKGYKVLLLDRDSFPSDTISTHIILAKGFAKLTEWGLINKVIETNAPIVRQLKFDLGPFALIGSVPVPANGISEIICPRRILLDKILVDAAVDAGAELREECEVEEILMEGETVTGVRCKMKNGKEFVEKAKIIIGADGRNSKVAITVKAEEYNNVDKLTCWYYSYWSGIPIDALVMYSRPYRAIGAIPTNHQMVCIPVALPAEEFVSFRSDIEGNYMKSIELVEELAEYVHHGKRETPFTGMAHLPNFFRKPFGLGWALVGDAGYHKDPITGQGISDAFVYSEKLVEAVDAGLSGREPIHEVLARYQVERDTESMPMYGFTVDFANLAPPPPEMEALFTALYTNQKETNRFIGTIAGTVPLPEFFAPENIERIIMEGQMTN